jgi:predicted nucleic acid-binding protein
VKKILSLEDAIKIINIFKRYCEKNMILEPEDKYIDAALDIALKHGITVYDSLYVAQAQHNNKPLLTLDAKQKNAAKRLGIEVIEL